MGCIRGISDRDGSCAVNFFSHQPALNYGFYKPDRDWQQPMDAPGPIAIPRGSQGHNEILACNGLRRIPR